MIAVGKWKKLMPDGGTSGGGLVITPETLLTASTQMLRSSEALNNKVKEIESSIAEIERVWKDNDGKVYLEKFSSLKPVIGSFINTAKSYGDFTKYAHDVYLETLEDNTTSVTG